MDAYGQIYKVGITSARCLDSRITTVARKHRLTAQIIVWTRLIDPRDAESRILGIGRPAQMKGVDGHTEFRSMTDKDLAQVIDIITEYSDRHISC